jgi:hypothetical protein
VFWPWVIFLVGGSLAAVIYFYRKETQQNGEGKAHGNGNGNGKRKKNKKMKESSKAALSEASVGEASNDSSKGNYHNNHGEGSKKNK